MANKVDIAVAATPGLVSILIPCCGMLEYTKLCVPSVLKNSRPQFELIFLDIGSLDGTAEYLAGLQAGLAGHLGMQPELTGQVRIEVVRTATDLGLKDACQRALKEVRGEWICLLNNDTVVTYGWLNQLTGLASFSLGIGLVGPMSNMAAVPDLVEKVAYRTSANPRMSAANPGGSLVDVSAVERFAAGFQKGHKGTFTYTDLARG